MTSETIKVHLIFQFVDGPWGGGNQFLRALRGEFRKRGIYSESPEEADVFLFNSHHLIDAVLRLRRQYPHKTFVHRIDGPMALQRGVLDPAADRSLFRLNTLIADGTIFQSRFSLEENKSDGFYSEKPIAILCNAVDSSIFFPANPRPAPSLPRKVVSSIWSNNPNKGYEIFDTLDKHLDPKQFEVTLFSPLRKQFRHVKLRQPVSSGELAETLRNSTIFLACSLYDPCSNSVLEAQACGLRCVLRQSGGHPELAQEGDQMFYGSKDVIGAIMLAAAGSECKGISPTISRSIEKVADSYYRFFQEVNRAKAPSRDISRSDLISFKLRENVRKLKSKFPGFGERQMDYHRRVLVLGDSDRSALSVIRSFGSRGIPVDLLTFEPRTLCRESRYLGQTHIVDEFAEWNPFWIDGLHAILRKHYYHALIPTTDKYLVPLFEHRHEFEASCEILLPNEQGFQATFNKDQTFKLAEELSIPTPKSFCITNLDDFNKGVEQGIFGGFPLVVKPVRSFVGIQIDRNQSKVGIASNPCQLSALVGGLLLNGPVQIQEFIAGEIIGQEFLAREGMVLDRFQHARLNEPLGGGGSSYRCSMEPDPEILAHSEKMLARVKYTGVAMFEYKFNTNLPERCKLLEINGRFWGSLPLAQMCGKDFPYHYYRSYLDPHYTLPTIPVVSREPVRYARHLSADLSNCMAQFKNAPSTGQFLRLLKYGGKGVLRLLKRRERIDTFTWDDPLPFLIEVKRLVWNRLQNRLRKLAVKRENSLAHKIIGGLNFTEIIFVCTGNICRSPFAAALTKKHMPVIPVRSAGIFPTCQDESPLKIQKAAEVFEVELRTHRASKIDVRGISPTTMVICFDLSHLRALRNYLPKRYHKNIFLLSAFGNRDYEVADPRRLTSRDIVTVFSEIEEGVLALQRVCGQNFHNS